MPASLNPKLAFSTLGCPDWSWTEILTRGPNYGYQGVEIRLLRRETNLLEVAEFRAVDRARRRRELDEAGLAACGLASSVHFDEFDRNARAKELGVGRQYVDLARELGAGFIRVFGDVLPSEDGTRRGALEWIAEGIDSLAEYARAVDVQILLETHGDFSDSRNAAELMRLVSAPNAGILWDTHHPWRFLDEEIEESFVRMKPWVRHTHWKDSVAEPADSKTNGTEVDCAGEKLAAATLAKSLMGGHRHANYVLQGAGEFPTSVALRLLRDAGYDGWYCFEWEQMWHPEIADPSVAFPQFAREFRRQWGFHE